MLYRIYCSKKTLGSSNISWPITGHLMAICGLHLNSWSTLENLFITILKMSIKYISSFQHGKPVMWACHCKLYQACRYNWHSTLTACNITQICCYVTVQQLWGIYCVSAINTHCCHCFNLHLDVQCTTASNTT